MAIVRYSSENVPKPTQEDLDRIDAIKDEDIDYSDIPEVTDFSKFRPAVGCLRRFTDPTKSTGEKEAWVQTVFEDHVKK